jgi:hypothetical protein
MASAIFDTHAFIKRLTAAGMPEQQAEILAEESTRLVDEQVATKQMSRSCGRILSCSAPT